MTRTTNLLKPEKKVIIFVVFNFWGTYKQVGRYLKIMRHDRSNHLSLCVHTYCPKHINGHIKGFACEFLLILVEKQSNVKDPAEKCSIQNFRHTNLPNCTPSFELLHINLQVLFFQFFNVWFVGMVHRMSHESKHQPFQLLLASFF